MGLSGGLATNGGAAASSSGVYVPSNPGMDGLLAECHPMVTALISGQNLRPTAGRLELVKIPIGSQTLSVTNICAMQNQTGTGLTSGQNFFGLYSSGGTLLGQTADQTTNWGSNHDPGAVAISGGPISVSDANGYVFFAVLSNAATTTVGLRGAVTSLVPNGFLAAATYWMATNGTGRTTLPGSITIGSNASNNSFYWAGLS